jgi:hypothetical protein
MPSLAGLVTAAHPAENSKNSRIPHFAADFPAIGRLTNLHNLPDGKRAFLVIQIGG